MYSLREFLNRRQRKIGNCYRCGFAAFSGFRGGNSSPPQVTKCVRTNSRILQKVLKIENDSRAFARSKRFSEPCRARASVKNFSGFRRGGETAPDLFTRLNFGVWASSSTVEHSVCPVEDPRQQRWALSLMAEHPVCPDAHIKT